MSKRTTNVVHRLAFRRLGVLLGLPFGEHFHLLDLLGAGESLMLAQLGLAGEDVPISGAFERIKGSERSCRERGSRWMTSGSKVPEELFDLDVDVLEDLAEKRRRDVSPLVHRYRRAASIRMPELHVRSALPDLFETEAPQGRDHLPRLQGR